MSAKKQTPAVHRANIHNVSLTPGEQGGWTRQVAVNPVTGDVKEVVHILNGNDKDALVTTVQRIVEGDIIHRRVFIPKEGRTVSEVLTAKVDGQNLILAPVSMLDADGKLIHYYLNDVLDKFINDPSNSNLLPAGYGWDGKYTQTMLRRRTNFICFLAGFGLPTDELHALVDVLVNHSSNSVKLSWRDAFPIPEQDVQLPGPTTGQRDYWFVVKASGETELHIDPDAVVRFSEGDTLRAIHCQIIVSPTNQEKWLISAWELYSVES